MSGRNFDHVPPQANNTVTISTTPQVRIASGPIIRPSTGVPIRPAPVPIRKIPHDDTGGLTRTTTTTMNSPSPYQTMILKEEEVDYQGASTSGPLIPTTSGTAASGGGVNSFQQYQRGTSIAPNNGPGGGGMAMDQPAPVNLASKVAEVFLTAGHAFQKLGDLTLQLHTTTDADESKWSDKEVDNLRNALTRFAHDLDQISTCVNSRTTKHIKNDIKRRHMIEDSNPQQPKRIAIGVNSSGIGASGTTYTTIGSSMGAASVHTVPLGQKRVTIQPTNKVLTTRTVGQRYTVQGIQGTSSMMNNGGVVASTSGMPQLQQQTHQTQQQQQQRITRLVPSSSIGGTKLVPATTKRLIAAVPSGNMTTSTSSLMTSQPASGALVLD